jgi:hypothetical protein
MVIWLVAQHVLITEQIAVAAVVSRRSVFYCLDAFLIFGGPARLKRKRGRQPTLAGADREAMVVQLRDGKFRRAKDAQAWTEARTKHRLSLPGVYSLMRKAGGA